MPTLDTYKLENDAVQSLEEKLDLVDKATQKTGAELDTQFKSAVEALDNAKLAGLLDKQFKDGDVYKSVDAMQSDDSYTFLVQASLDAISQNGRYENLLRGKEGKYGVDDNYGSRTRAAVSQFQRDVGIKEDGIVGPETMAKLVAVLNGTVKIDLTKTIVDGAEVYAGKGPETPAKDLSQKTAEGILTVDAYGNKVNYVDSKDKIPSDKFNKPEFGANIYVYQGFQVYGNGRVLDITKNQMFDWKDLDARIAANKGVINTPASTATDTVPVATNKFGEEVFDKYVDDIKNRYTLDLIKKIAKNNPIAASFADGISGLSFTDANPNLAIKYRKNTQGRNSYELGTVNVREFISSSKKDYAGFDKKLVLLMEEAGKQDYYNKQLDNTIRGKEYVLSKLFRDKANDDGYKAYFDLFNDAKLLVDESSTYTKIVKIDNKLVLQFDLNDKKGDEEYNKDLTIPLEKILVNGKINTYSFELELKAKVKNIIDTHPELFGA